MGSETQPEQSHPEQEPACSFLPGSGALALLQEAPGTLVLLGRALLAGACLCFLSVGIRRRLAPRLRCEARQALSCTDNL